MQPALRRTLSTVEYFTFGFGTMIGVGWLVVIDDWLGRGGPAGAMLGFLIGGILLLPVALTYGRLVREIPDAGAEVAYAERVFPRFWSFAAGWVMVLAYAIVCPWEAVAIGNLLARAFPGIDKFPLYEISGRTIYATRLVAGLLLTGCIAWVNYRGIRPSGLFQDVTTFGLILAFAIFTALGFGRGDASNWEPLFARPGGLGAVVSVVLVLQIVPYFMTGFESIAKASEEAKPGFDPRNFARAIAAAIVAGGAFYFLVVAVVSYVYPWREIVAEGIGTELAFERAFGSRAIAQLILLGAILSLFKVFNGNFVAATRLAFALGRRGLVHTSLGRLDRRTGTPAVAISLLAAVTAAGAFLGDALLVPFSEVGALASGVGWFSACTAFLLLGGKAQPVRHRVLAVSGAAVAAGIVLMKIVPVVPGSFGVPEWAAFAGWCVLGLTFWLARPKRSGTGVGVASEVPS
ncbi:Amino-acid permease RocE [bacterium HR33]|nr:Amino-acid permease RocE [bacterium HR33]